MPAEPPPLSPSHLRAFREDLLDWYDQVRRAMPWRGDPDPYRIWLSEVMLQQTRVGQAEPYYERFVAAYPTVEDLADAPLDDVLLNWEGLGYYARARHLHRAAKSIVADYGGRVPDTYDAIRSLPGVGPYTAAAVLSIAYEKPHAVVDGNVVRVLARVFAIADDARRSPTRRRIQHLADALLEPARPGDFNQALMELGATVCTPSSPACPACPLNNACAAAALGTPEAFPVLKKKPPTPHHEVAVGLLFDERGRLLIQRRPDEGLLGGLWEFPGGKREDGERLEETCRRELREELGIEIADIEPFHSLRHAYTHFRITLFAFRCRIRSGTPTSRNDLPLQWVEPEALGEYAFPRANRRLIDQLRERGRQPMLFDR